MRNNAGDLRINDHKIVSERWERIYLEEGPEGFAGRTAGPQQQGSSAKAVAESR